ncbi:MAG: hypothetical protein KKC21_03900 [Nitrospinae bacterium]|nr:hypothetical protein [Nitrospinota bacterium]
MAEISKFQAMNGCSGCKQADGSAPQGEDISEADFWCSIFKKAVITKDGCSCPSWESD